MGFKVPVLPTDNVIQGVIRDYVKLARRSTESPVHFHIAVAIACLGAITERKVYLKRGTFRIYPNTYLMIISPSGISRKTTALRIGKKLISEVDESFLVPSGFTPESFVDILAKQPTRILFVDEIGAMLGSLEKKKYMSGLKELIIRLYDCPEREVRELRNTLSVAEAPFLSIVGTTTADWLSEGLQEMDIMSGFFNRWALIISGAREQVLPNPPVPSSKAWAAIVKGYREVRKMRGEMQFDPVAEDLYHKWYIETHKQANGYLASGIDSFWTRIEDYALKFSMIFCLSQHKMRIEKEHMDAAIEIANYLKQAVLFLLSEELAWTNHMKMKRKIVRLLKAAGGTDTRSNLMRRSSLSKRELDSVIETLIASEIVKQGRIDTEGRPKTTYTLI